MRVLDISDSTNFCTKVEPVFGHNGRARQNDRAG